MHRKKTTSAEPLPYHTTRNYEFSEMSLRGDTAASAVKADAVAGSYGIVR